MSKTEILLETGTNEFELIEFYVDQRVAVENKAENKAEDQGEDGGQCGHDGHDGGQGIDRHHFGVNVAKVLEVVEAPEGLEPSPSAPHPSFLGTIPLRDIILPVIDLSIWLEMDRARCENEPIIVTEFNNVVTGFLVSGVTMIHRVNWSDIEPPSHMVANMPTNCITGTVQLDNRFALILDLERALSELNPEYAPELGEDEDAPHVEPDEGRQLSVLIADDSTPVRALLTQNFTKAGFTVQTCIDGGEAWDNLNRIKAEAQEQGKPVTALLDAVVSDVEMPRMDGYTLTKRIKEDPELSRLPVVLFSSLISKGLQHKGESVQADDQVTKPEFHELTGRVIQAIEKKKAQA